MKGEYTTVKYIDDKGATRWATCRAVNVGDMEKRLSARGFVVDFCSVTGAPLSKRGAAEPEDDDVPTEAECDRCGDLIHGRGIIPAGGYVCPRCLKEGE